MIAQRIKTSLVLILPLASSAVTEVLSVQHPRGWHALPFRAAAMIADIILDDYCSLGQKIIAAVAGIVGVALLAICGWAGVCSYRKEDVRYATITVVLGVTGLLAWALVTLFSMGIITFPDLSGLSVG